MRYQELAPSPQLAPWVHCVWIFESEAGSAGADRIVPDGRPELVIHFGRPFAELDGSGASTPQRQAVFAGQVTRPLVLRSDGAAGVVGVRFRPAGARAFLGMPMRHATDQRIAVEGLFEGDGANLAGDIASARGVEDRARIAEAFVMRRIAHHAHEDDAIAQRSSASVACST